MFRSWVEACVGIQPVLMVILLDVLCCCYYLYWQSCSVNIQLLFIRPDHYTNEPGWQILNWHVYVYPTHVYNYIEVTALLNEQYIETSIFTNLENTINFTRTPASFTHLDITINYTRTVLAQYYRAQTLIKQLNCGIRSVSTEFAKVICIEGGNLCWSRYPTLYNLYLLSRRTGT